MTSKSTPLRIAINAQLAPAWGTGGIYGILTGLVAALGQLTDGPEEYVVIGPREDPEWLAPYLGPKQRILPGPAPRDLWPAIKSSLGPLRPLAGRAWRALRGSPPPPAPALVPHLQVSNGFYERLGCGVIHFPSQALTLCALPMVYSPHDLQHLHYPEFFSPTDIAAREEVYPLACRVAHTVTVAAQWVRDDVERHYQICRRKLAVIPWAAPTVFQEAASEEVRARVRDKYQLTEPFAFFPAATWPHKNHLRLLEAVALLRDRHRLVVPLLCSGSQLERHWPAIEEQQRALGLVEQVRFLGGVPAREVRALYSLAQFTVFPSLFEGGALPLLESWLEGTPVTCARSTMLPELAGAAALLFDPNSPEAIAGAIAAMAKDPSLRADLSRAGRERLREFTWERTAKTYRAVYRKAARRALNEEDRALLQVASGESDHGRSAMPRPGQSSTVAN
ncbi:MAG TPA: glycosyltransferase family 1 protein [Vicinamibacteria bacterium]|nr:glycosyltransferase family 1 protein [Vicinamibacteria bacterium]